MALQYESLKKAKADAVIAQQAASGKQPLDPLGQVFLVLQWWIHMKFMCQNL